jgi:RNA recognition motif-containing protein
VALKKAVNKEETRKIAEQDKQTKLFLSGVTASLKNSEVKKYFQCFGKVKDVKLMPTKTGNGVGFIVFQDFETVNKVLSHAEIHLVSSHKVT